MRDTLDWQIWQIVDSAFPVGVFAHSWGLEAAWYSGYVDSDAALQQFVVDSIQQTGWGMLPLLNSAYLQPVRLSELDTLAHAFLTNNVANRTSRVQGRTLAATAARVWPSRAMCEIQARVEGGHAHVARRRPVFRLGRRGQRAEVGGGPRLGGCRGCGRIHI